MNTNNIQMGGLKNLEKIKEFKKFFKDQMKRIDYIKIQLKPYLQYGDDNNNFVKIKKIDKKLEKIFKKKLDKNYKKIITDSMLYNINIIKYKYDSKLNIVNIYIKPELKFFEFWYDISSIPHSILSILNGYAWNIQYELEEGDRHWLDGDAVYIKKKEYDNKEYILFANFYSSSLFFDNKTKIVGYNCDIRKDGDFKSKCKLFYNFNISK